MKSQRRFAPKGDRNKPESVACLAGISILPIYFNFLNFDLQYLQFQSCFNDQIIPRKINHGF